MYSSGARQNPLKGRRDRPTSADPNKTESLQDKLGDWFEPIPSFYGMHVAATLTAGLFNGVKSEGEDKRRAP